MAHTTQEVKNLCEHITGEFEEYGFYNAINIFNYCKSVESGFFLTYSIYEYSRI